ncbi:LuxR family transcriptional regulator [Ornithinimicrobium ciconiae]|uniref:LuxR family transcriptional regulator n=1 Tax=Ornithinimicrobium ciconiae TaxID=2594265 RepID=A0A516G9Y9_9MICO|nr:cupin domain-containing protein [Ornithinimicrobium ciconiae]QDO88336.1 LuxR family transcriptional regulator [Ornithinimicrobium ciconiae]
MESTSVVKLIDEQLAKAHAASSGRAAVTLHGGHDHDLRQTLIVLVEGRSLNEHETPGEATLQVLRGQVRLGAGDDVWEGSAGDFLVIPAARHDLAALSDAAVLLTVATRA